MNGTSELLHSLSMGCAAPLGPYKATALTRQHIFSIFLTEKKKKKEKKKAIFSLKSLEALLESTL